MSFSLTPTRRFRFGQPGWSGVAFIAEALLLLLFLAACTAIFVRLFSGATVQAREADELTRAVAAAQTAAERFSADPTSLAPVSTDGDLVVVCTTTAEPTSAGTLYHADIRVYVAGEGADVPAIAGGSGPADAEPVYAISTAVYVPGAKGGGAA